MKEERKEEEEGKKRVSIYSGVGERKEGRKEGGERKGGGKRSYVVE